jgi:hypothetical protein
LNDAGKRQLFAQLVFGSAAATPPVPFFFSAATSDAGEEMPDFHKPEFDMLRSCFLADYTNMKALVERTSAGSVLLDDTAALERYF